MTADTYELIYWPFWALVDVSRLILEHSGAQYKYTPIQGHDDFQAQKPQHRFGRIPKLIIHSADGTTKDLWESSVVEMYLAEVLGLLPKDAYERANILTYYSSQRELLDKQSDVNQKATSEERRKALETLKKDTIPAHLKYHEAAVKGPYYIGDKVTLPDISLVSMYLRFEEIYCEGNPFTAFPKLTQLVSSILAGPKVEDYVKTRRDGALVFSKEEGKYVMRST